jgi:hypothetical protein
MATRLVSALHLVELALLLMGCGGVSKHDVERQTGPDAPDRIGQDAAVPEPSPWSGHTYYLDIAKVSWTTPRDVGLDLFGFAPSLLFQVDGSGADLTVTIGTAPATRERGPELPPLVPALPGRWRAVLRDGRRGRSRRGRGAEPHARRGRRSGASGRLCQHAGALTRSSRAAYFALRFFG